MNSSLWAVPTLVVALILGLAELPMQFEQRLSPAMADLFFAGGPESARSILSTIASAMITFTGLVFSVTILVLQLTSAQYSPRTLRRFLADRTTKVSLGIFVATFTHALLVLRLVTPEEEGGTPRLAVTFAVALVALSVAAFVYYLHHMARSIQVTSIIAAIAEETREAIARRYPEERPSGQGRLQPDLPPTATVAAPKAGSLRRVDESRLIEMAREAGGVLELVPAVGDFVPAGHPLLRGYRGWPEELDRPAVLEKLIELGQDRSVEQDPAYGMRQLVDVAQKALSPGINDPTTAVQALDQIHALLRVLVTRPFPEDARYDEEGQLRLIVHEATWEDYVSLGLDEIRHYGSSSVQVHRRMRALLEDLLQIAPPPRREPLLLRMRALDEAAVEGFNQRVDRKLASQPDLQGIGS